MHFDFGLLGARATQHVLLADHGYAIMVDSRTAALPFAWSIVNARTREVVRVSRVGHRSMEAAFTATGSTLRAWMNGDRSQA
jgi:hypothetical protein